MVLLHVHAADAPDVAHVKLLSGTAGACDHPITTPLK